MCCNCVHVITHICTHTHTRIQYSLLSDKPNFKFEFRDSLQFKNVPEPIKCYYLLDNTLKEEHTAIIVSEETEQVTYHQFVMSRSPDTPPASPHLPENLADQLSSTMQSDDFKTGCPFMTPDFNVIKPTPTSTPNPTPPSSRKNSSETSPAFCPPVYSVSPPTPLNSVPCLDTTEGIDSGDDVHFHIPTTFMASMRNTSMSPLREDLNEEEHFSSSSSAPNIVDEGIVLRKLSDISNSSCSSGGGAEQNGVETSTVEAQSSATKLPSRKISDVSNHSGESGIESTTSKVSDGSGGTCDRDVSKNSTSNERKLSTSSNGSTEDELTQIRTTRAGSVHNTIVKFDTLTRQRKSGLPTVVHHHNGDDHLHKSVSSQSV